MCIKNAKKGKYAIGAFNVYNLEGIEAVVATAEEERSPAILQFEPDRMSTQIVARILIKALMAMPAPDFSLCLFLIPERVIHPSALKQGGIPLVACCIYAAKQARVPITVHFDHGNSKKELVEVLQLDLDSAMVDGSELNFIENITYTKFIANLAHDKGILVEAELGRLSGTEGELTVEDFEAKLTDIEQNGVNKLADLVGVTLGPKGRNVN